MRLSGLALAAALALAASAAAQQQAPPQLPRASAAPVTSAPQPASIDPALEGYLRRWEQEMQRYRTLQLDFQRIDEDKTLRSVTKYNGNAYFMKTGTGPTARNLVLLQTALEGSKEIAEKYVCSGTYFYMFNRDAKEVVARELPKAAPGAMPDDNFLGMFGLRSEEAKRRYDLKLGAQDDKFIYINIRPRLRRDQEEFEMARIVLTKDTFVPRQLWYRQPNKTEVVWDIQRTQVDGKMDQRWFDQPATPAGWKFRKIAADADAPPKIIRNSGNP
jgi:TIGR03009 family protein